MPMFSTSSVLKDSLKHNSQQLDTRYPSKSNTRPPNPCPSDNSNPPVNSSLPMTNHNKVTQEVRPLPSNSQFVSAIQTLTESIQDPGQDYIFGHDLAEAYNLLSTRIRSQVQVILASDKCEQLAIFSQHSPQILECLSRDLRRVLPNPFASQHYAWLNDSCDVGDAFDDEEFQIASDNSTVCHYALLFVSDIFTFPALYAVFTDDELRALLHDALCICTTPDRPFPNSQKLYGMVVWLLKIQHLPPIILSAEMPAIISVLRDAIILEPGGAIARLDAFRAIHHLLKRHPNFTDAFTALLPPVLDHLNSPSIEVRIHAACGLSGFAQAKLCSTRSRDYPTDDISEIVQGYMEVQTSRKKSLDQSTLLPAISLSALDGETLWDGKGPSFAVVVVSCLIVLLDQSLFDIPHCLKFVFPFLGRCKVHKRSPVRKVQPRMWQLTVWAFSRVSRPKVIKKNEHDLDKRQRVALIVSQDPSPEVFVYLVACLLEGEATTWDFERALDITEKLAASDDGEDNATGLEFLSRFLSNIDFAKSSPSLRTNTRIAPIAGELLDGSLLSRRASDMRLTEGPSCMSDVIPFPEQQILDLWPMFSKIWTIYVQRFLLGPDTQLAANLLDIWQSLLLVQAQLTQGNQHLTSPPSFGTKVISVMTKLPTSLSSTTDQSKYLSLISKLWSTTKNVFTVSWLESPAEKLLASLLTRPFDLTDENVKEQWSQLCADLISVGIPTVLHVLRVRSESQEGMEVTRQLWHVLAKHGPLAAGHEDWIGILHFLVMPFGAWTLSSTEIDLWEDLFARSVQMALKASRTPHDAVSQLMELLGDKKNPLFKELPSLLKCLLIHYVSAESCTVEPIFFKMLDEAVTTSYHQPLWDMSHTFEILRLMAKVLAKTPEGHIAEAIAAIQTCLACWIADDANILADDEHDIIVTNLYCEPLEIVSQLPPSMKTLSAIAPFLQSVFVRIRGRGPIAFQKFWRACYHKRPEFEHERCPELVQTCLRGWGDFCDDSVADNLSLRSGTQSLMPSLPNSRPLPLSGWSPEKSGWNEVAESGSPVARPTLGDGEVDSQQSGSNVTITPIRGKTAAETSRLLHAQALSDFHGAGEVHAPHELHAHLSNVSSISGTKRPAFVEVYSTPKRRRTEPDIHPKPRSGKDREIEQLPVPLAASSKGKAPVSKPVTRASSSTFLPAFSLSQPAQGLGLPDESEETEYSRRIFGYSSTRYGSRPSPPAPAPPSDDYDYDGWEQAVSEQDLRRVQAEMLGENDGLAVPDSEEMVADLIITDADHQTACENDDVFGPSTSDYPLRSRRRERSQTAPEISVETFPPVEYPPPLRRNLTSPLHRKTSSLQLEALQKAYAIVTDTGTSQVDVQDIMHARRLANQINQVLDEQMCSKFGAGKDDPP